MSSLYIHIPFCRRKCLYCDFFSAGVQAADWPRYAGAILSELDARCGEMDAPPSTIYFGGGTPSMMPDSEFRMLAEGLSARFGGLESVREFTIEVNPDDVTDEKVELWRACGVNRVSIGVQSFNDDELGRIGRLHTSERAMDALGILGKVFDNISLDLIFALPGQTCDDWRRNVETLMSLDVRPAHISAYALMYEEGTPLTVLRDGNRLTPVDDDTYVGMFSYFSRTLADAGYRQYEISNYALPGFESMHNSGYWSGEPYLGLGPSAHSYDGHRVRRANPPRLNRYLNAANNGFNSPFYEEEKLSDEELREEYILTRMRTAEGIGISDYSARFGEKESGTLMSKAAGHIRSGHLMLDKGRLSLTPAGIMVSDPVIADLA